MVVSSISISLSPISVCDDLIYLPVPLYYIFLFVSEKRIAAFSLHDCFPILSFITSFFPCESSLCLPLRFQECIGIIESCANAFPRFDPSTQLKFLLRLPSPSPYSIPTAEYARTQTKAIWRSVGFFPCFFLSFPFCVWFRCRLVGHPGFSLSPDLPEVRTATKKIQGFMLAGVLQPSPRCSLKPLISPFPPKC